MPRIMLFVSITPISQCNERLIILLKVIPHNTNTIALILRTEPLVTAAFEMNCALFITKIAPLTVFVLII